MTTHELAELLLSKENMLLKLGKFVSNCGDTWWEEVEGIKVTFGEEGCIIEEEL